MKKARARKSTPATAAATDVADATAAEAPPPATESAPRNGHPVPFEEGDDVPEGVTTEALAEATQELAESIQAAEGTGTIHGDAVKTVLQNATGETIAEIEPVPSLNAVACMECNEPNNLDATVCQKCGAPIVPPKLQELGATPKTIRAAAGALVDHARNAQDAETVERGGAPEPVAPKGTRDKPSENQSDLPLDFGPFNPDNALRAIFDKQIDVKRLEEDYDEKKEEASEAKKALDKGNRELTNLIESFRRQRQQALNPSQPFLRPVDTEAPVKPQSGCRLEREGKKCHICEEARARKLQPRTDSAVHPEHQDHETVGLRAYREYELKPLQARLLAATPPVQLTLADLEIIDAPTIAEIVKWLDAPGPIPPQIFALSCIATAPGTMAQCCRTCDRVLATAKPNETTVWFVEGTLVGLECAGKGGDNQEQEEEAMQDSEPTQTPTTTDQPDQPEGSPGLPPASEPARPDAPATENPTPPVEETKARKPRSHATRQGTARREPERERSQQAKGNRRPVKAKGKSGKRR